MVENTCIEWCQTEKWMKKADFSLMLGFCTICYDDMELQSLLSMLSILHGIELRNNPSGGLLKLSDEKNGNTNRCTDFRSRRQGHVILAC